MATLDEQIRDVGRELGMRRACYPKWVKGGRMTQAQAEHQIECMDDIYKLLKSLKAKARMTPSSQPSALREALIKALEPFAIHAEYYDDDKGLRFADDQVVSVTLKDCRIAYAVHAALSAPEAQKPEYEIIEESFLDTPNGLLQEAQKCLNESNSPSRLRKRIDALLARRPT